MNKDMIIGILLIILFVIAVVGLLILAWIIHPIIFLFSLLMFVAGCLIGNE